MSCWGRCRMIGGWQQPAAPRVFGQGRRLAAAGASTRRGAWTCVLSCVCACGLFCPPLCAAVSCAFAESIEMRGIKQCLSSEVSATTVLGQAASQPGSPPASEPVALLSVQAARRPASCGTAVSAGLARCGCFVLPRGIHSMPPNTRFCWLMRLGASAAAAAAAAALS